MANHPLNDQCHVNDQIFSGKGLLELTDPHIHCGCPYNLFIYLGFYVAFKTVEVISRPVVGRAEETSTYSSSGFCTVNCRPTASNYQLSHLRLCQEPNPGLSGGRRECYTLCQQWPPAVHTSLYPQLNLVSKDIHTVIFKLYPK